MSHTITKPSIIITSLGRTGTQFFATLFQNILPHTTSLHEPDVLNIIQYPTWGERVRQLRQQIRESGATNLLLRKLLGRWSLIKLADGRLCQHLSDEVARHQLRSQRAQFIATRPGQIYVESNIAYYGLIDLLPDVFQQHRLIYLVRDGRDWVRSHLNWGQMYNKHGLRRKIAHNWPTARDLPSDPYHEAWPQMTRFERLCWAWTRLNEFALASLPQNPHARLFRFEEIFKAEKRYDNLAELVNFATDFTTPNPGPLEGWLSQKIHPSHSEFPPWRDWSATHTQQFETHCGPLMSRLGYW